MDDERTAQPEGTGNPPTAPPAGTQDQDTNTAPEVDTTQAKDAPQRPPETEREKGLKRELYNLRSKNREYRSALDALRQDVESLKAGRGAVAQPAPPTETAGVSLLDNPELFQANLEKKLSTSLETRLTGIIERRERESRLEAEGRAAESWLLAQKEIKEDPAALDEITEILSDPELARVAQVSPRVAAKHALDAWKEQKGLAGPRNDAGRTAAARTHSVPPSAGGSGHSDKKMWTVAEAKAYTASLDHRSADFNKKYAVIEQAMKEGRIK